jgi:hypothetical protein
MLLNGDISPIHKMKTAGVAKARPEEWVNEGEIEHAPSMPAHCQ